MSNENKMKVLRCFFIVPAALSGCVIGYEYRCLLHMAGPMTQVEVADSPWLTAFVLSQVLSVILPVVLAVAVAPFHKKAVGWAVSLVSVQQVLWQLISKSALAPVLLELPYFAYEIAAAASVFAAAFTVLLVSSERVQTNSEIQHTGVQKTRV